MTATSTGLPLPANRSPEGRAIAEGRAVLGIELGSTRIKGVLVDRDGHVLAVGDHTWENQLVDGRWTYAEEDIWSGLQQCYAAVAADANARHGIRPTNLAALGVSAMMHGYLATDTAGELLVPFRTWRNTSTRQAAAELTDLLGVNIPLRWSVAHLYQAILEGEPHVAEIAGLTTLAGLVHHRLSGRHVLGVGDASGMFPIDPATKDYDADALVRFDRLIAERCPDLHLAALLPEVLAAGQEAGSLSAEGATLLDPTGTLLAGAPMCPPEGDAGTGMVATNAVTPRTGNVSVGTSIFAMAVLEHPLRRVHHAIDVVTTPAGDPVAMVHCNNGASELDAWAALFGELADAVGSPTVRDTVFAAMLGSALGAEADAGGLVAFNYLAGEPVTGLEVGRPLFFRTPDSRLTLGSFVRAQVFGTFATLALGLRALADEDVALDVLVAHGGLFRTEGVAQRLLAGALNTPVELGQSAGEGGAWGIAVLACYLADDTNELDLGRWLDMHIFDGGHAVTVTPDPADVAGFATYLSRFEAGLEVERSAATAV